MFNEALSDAEMFTDEELEALEWRATTDAKAGVEYFGVPEHYAAERRLCRVAILDRWITENLYVWVEPLLPEFPPQHVVDKMFANAVISALRNWGTLRPKMRARVDHWLAGSPALTPEMRSKVDHSLAQSSPAAA